MSDAATRELERQAAQGDPAAEERVLVARLRSGTIAVDRVEFAAWCGSPVARAAMGRQTREDRPVERLLALLALKMPAARLTDDLGGHDAAAWKEAGVLAAVAMAEVAQKRWHERRAAREPDHDRHATGAGERAAQARRHSLVPMPGYSSCSDPTCDLALRSIAAARRWVDEPAMRAPSSSLCFMLARMQARATGLMADSWQREELDLGRSRTGHELWAGAACAMAAHDGGRADLLGRCLESARAEVIYAARPEPDVVAVQRQKIADEAIRPAVASALIAWCLR